MSISNLMALLGLSVLLTSCSTTSLNMDAIGSSKANMSEKGVQYLLGRGVPQSDTQAFYYFKRAADEGNPFAENEVAYMYAVGKGAEQDDRKALEYYLRAAEHGIASAQYNLGLLYLHGKGTSPSDERATFWFEKSAAQGFEPAKKILKRRS